MKGKALVVWLILGVLLTGGVLRAEDEGPPAGDVRYAAFEVAGELPETLPPVYLVEPQTETLHELLTRLRKAAKDERLAGLIVHVHGFAGGWAKAQEVRKAIIENRAAGKRVICVLESPGTLTYYVATAADRVVITPAGNLMVSGLRIEAVFARKLLDTIGVKADLIQAGKYKTAGEELTRTDFSEPARRALRAVLEDYYGQLRDGIAAGRAVSAERAEQFLDGGPYTAEAAREVGLVDDVLYRDELIADLERRHGKPVTVVTGYALATSGARRPSGGMNIFQFLMPSRPPSRIAPSGPAVAVVYAVGPILRTQDSDLSIGDQVAAADRINAAIRAALHEPNVKAIVLRVNSPGGSALASDLIWRQAHLANAEKPVVASMSDTAASGGYYVAAGARRIVAEPGTLTGSIGVVGGKLVVADLFEKIGLTVDVIQAGEGGGMFSSFREFDAVERARMRRLIGDIYDQFLDRVAQTRRALTAVEVDEVAQGQIWTGRQAEERHLVDRLGGLSDAIRLAAEEAGIPEDADIKVVHLPRPRSLLEALFFGPGVSAPTRDLTGVLARFPRLQGYVRGLMALREEPTLCLMPALLFIR